jgi:cyclopropane fatty-acyl-phospholipid synthase-like methyltransferase
MHCPFLKKFDTHMCVTADSSIIPSQRHREQYCQTSSHWACPLKERFSEVAAAFSYSI